MTDKNEKKDYEVLKIGNVTVRDYGRAKPHSRMYKRGYTISIGTGNTNAPEKPTTEKPTKTGE